MVMESVVLSGEHSRYGPTLSMDRCNEGDSRTIDRILLSVRQGRHRSDARRMRGTLILRE
jgi:hypothetical protein